MTDKLWIAIAYQYTHSLSAQSFISHFGIDPNKMEALWTILTTPKKSINFSAHHLLWTLYFLKNLSSNLAVILSHLSCTINTFWKWVILGLKLIVFKLPQVCLCYVCFNSLIVSIDSTYEKHFGSTIQHFVLIQHLPLYISLIYLLGNIGIVNIIVMN
jgi:hypothetical protein